MKELRELGTFVADFHLKDAPKAVVSAAIDCVMDTLSVSMGAKNNPLFSNMKRIYAEHEGTGCISATVWGTGEQVPVHTAAFLNAMAAHTLELDDVHTSSKTHIGAVVVPAAWAVAESTGASGSDLLEAVICGYEVMSRIGMGFGVSAHRNKGWHVTGTAGTFGAAAACAKLYGFTADQVVSALGLAGMQSCSTWAFLTGGATDKVMHTARAAASGLESCLMVQAGMIGTSHILDAADGGLFPAMSDGYDYALVSRGLGEVFEILRVDKKPYPCCRSTHGSIDAAIFLRETEPINVKDIERVDINTYLVGLKQCGVSEGSLHPTTATEAKFSTPYVAAVGLLQGSVGLSDFLPEKINDPVRQALLSRIFVHEAKDYTREYPAHWGCSMRITMKNGRTFVKHIEDASGSVTEPLTKAQLRNKALGCCSEYPKEALETLLQEVQQLAACKKLPKMKL